MGSRPDRNEHFRHGVRRQPLRNLPPAPGPSVIFGCVGGIPQVLRTSSVLSSWAAQDLGGLGDLGDRGNLWFPAGDCGCSVANETQGGGEEYPGEAHAVVVQEEIGRSSRIWFLFLLILLFYFGLHETLHVVPSLRNTINHSQTNLHNEKTT